MTRVVFIFSLLASTCFLAELTHAACSSWDYHPSACANMIGTGGLPLPPNMPAPDECFYCASQNACWDVSKRSACPGYVDPCSTFNGDYNGCFSFLYTVTLGFTVFSQFCVTSSVASGGAVSTCSACRFCYATQQCLTASRHTELCASPWGGVCSFFDGQQSGCNSFYSASPSASSSFSSCPLNIYPQGCGNCTFCAATQRCMAQAAISSTNCCGYSSTCSAWNGNSSCSSNNFVPPSPTMVSFWRYCSLNCTCYYNYDTKLCKEVTDPCHRIVEPGECVAAGCAYCPSMMLCVPLAKGPSECSGWSDPCNSFNFLEYECKENISCVYCPAERKCQPRTILKTSPASCVINCSAKYRYDRSGCALSGCNYCTSTGLCAPGTDLSCANQCSTFNYAASACRVLGCFYCVASYRCFATADECDVCESVFVSSGQCNTMVYNYSTKSAVLSGICPVGGNCTACSYCFGESRCFAASRVCSPCASFSSVPDSCMQVFAVDTGLTDYCPSGSSCVKCAYCNTTRQCTTLSNALATCPFFTSNCSLGDGRPDSCNEYMLLSSGSSGWSFVNVAQRQCGYCAFTQRCLNRSSMGTVCPSAGGCFDTDASRCHSNSSCGFCGSAPGCMLLSTINTFCPGYTPCAVNQQQWSCNNDENCAFCRNTSRCLPFSAMSAQLCPSWESDCDLWTFHPESCTNSADARIKGRCVFCPRTMQCLLRTSYLAQCPGATSLCSAYISRAYCQPTFDYLSPVFCRWCAGSCIANTSTTCQSVCVDMLGPGACQNAGCYWCASMYSCASTAAECDPCAGNYFQYEPWRCNARSYHYAGNSWIYGFCSPGQNCTNCFACNRTGWCVGDRRINNSTRTIGAVCPGWNSTCSAWDTTPGQPLVSTGCTSSSNTDQPCEYCPATGACVSNATFNVQTCPTSFHCSSFNYNPTSCSSTPGCFYCNEGVNGSKCLLASLDPTAVCDICSSYSYNPSTCNQISYRSARQDVSYSPCSPGELCIKCFYCPSTQQCLTNTTLASRCPGWSSPCDSWNIPGSYYSGDSCQETQYASCVFCSNIDQAMYPGKYCWSSSSPMLKAACPNVCGTYYNQAKCNRDASCNYCQLNSLTNCLPKEQICQACIFYSYSARECTGSSPSSGVQCAFCPATQQCLTISPQPSCPGWTDLCSSFNNGQASDCNRFSRSTINCGFCHATGKCLNLTQLTAATCSSHQDACSVWGNDTSRCINSVFVRGRGPWMTPPCIAGMCDYCSFCAKTNKCMTVQNAQSSCGPWGGPCSLYTSTVCAQIAANGTNVMFYNPQASVVMACPVPSCCNAKCAVCQATDGCNTVKTGDADTCSQGAMVGAAGAAPGTGSSSAESGGSGVVIGVIAGVVLLVVGGGGVGKFLNKAKAAARTDVALDGAGQHSLSAMMMQPHQPAPMLQQQPLHGAYMAPSQQYHPPSQQQFQSPQQQFQPSQQQFQPPQQQYPAQQQSPQNQPLMMQPHQPLQPHKPLPDEMGDDDL